MSLSSFIKNRIKDIFFPRIQSLRRGDSEEARQNQHYEQFKLLQPEILRKFRGVDSSKYAMDAWRDFLSNLVDDFGSCPPINFLETDTVKNTLSSDPTYPRYQYYLDQISVLGKLPPNLLAEDWFGNPRIHNKVFHTSFGRILHAYILSLLLHHGKLDEMKKPVVVEWGGGYGGFARLLMRCLPNTTYVILDLPEMCALSSLYLKVTLGPEKVNDIFDSNTYHLIQGAVNIIPCGMLDRIDIKADAFVSTWALSESNDLAQEAVFQRTFWGANTVLLAHQMPNDMFPFADRLSDISFDSRVEINLPAPFKKDKLIVGIK